MSTATLSDRIEYFKHKLSGNLSPRSREVKQKILESYIKDFPVKIFVETGTFKGDTTAAMADKFDQIYTIELGNQLYKDATKRFNNQKHITVLQGDSGEQIKKLLPKLSKPTFFWLDAHYSGGITAQGDEWSPVVKELQNIMNHGTKGHVVLIDDARGFTGNQSPTLRQLKEIAEQKPNGHFSVKDDIIRIHW